MIMIKQTRLRTRLQAAMTSFDTDDRVVQREPVHVTPAVNLSERLILKTSSLSKCSVNLKDLKDERYTIVNNSTVGDLWNSLLEGVIYGGKYQPSECTPDQNLAVIIPYRDRKKHLEILTNSLHTLFQKQKLKYTIYVVELALPTRFNRGLLLNIGYQVALTISNHDCFVFHDVDLIPLNEKNLYKCTATPRHLVSSNSKFSYKLPYAGYVGGAFIIQASQYKLINGFSNAYFGLGGEDDDFRKRLSSKHLKYDRPSSTVGKYFALSHGTDASNPKNPERIGILSKASSRQTNEGINSLKYKVLAIEFRPSYTWIYVKCDEMEVMTSSGFKIE